MTLWIRSKEDKYPPKLIDKEEVLKILDSQKTPVETWQELCNLFLPVPLTKVRWMEGKFVLGYWLYFVIDGWLNYRKEKDREYNLIFLFHNNCQVSNDIPSYSVVPPKMKILGG